MLLQPLGHLSAGNWRRPDHPHPGTRVRCRRCSLPSLTGFTTCHREGTGGVTIVPELIGPNVCIAERVVNTRFEDLSTEAVTITKQCLMDFIGIALARMMM